MSTHNVCFRRQIRKILCGYSLLAVAMCIALDKRGYQENISIISP